MPKEKILLKNLQQLYRDKTPEDFKKAFQALYNSSEFKILLSDRYFKMFFEFRDALDGQTDEMPKIMLNFYKGRHQNRQAEALKTIIEAIEGTFGNVEVSYWLFLGATEPGTAKTDCYFEIFEELSLYDDFEEFEFDEEGRSWAAVQEYLHVETN